MGRYSSPTAIRSLPELLEHRADAPQPGMDRGPVLVVTAARLVLAQLRVLADAVDDVDPKAVDAAGQPEAQHVVHRRLDLGLVPVEVGLLGQERVQLPLAAAPVERPGRLARGGTASATRWAGRARRTSGGARPGRRGTRGGGRRCGWGPSRRPRAARGRARRRPGRRSRRACRTPDPRRSSRRRRSRSRPSARGRTATATAPRRRGHADGRAGAARPRRSPTPSPSASAKDRG